MRTEELPEQFLESMKRMLGTEYQDYISSMKDQQNNARAVYGYLSISCRAGAVE